MKITYTSPNRSHHYPYAKAMHKAGHLHAFVSGFSRLSPRASLREIGDKLKRHDFFQTLYLASMKFNSPQSVVALFNQLSNRRLDQASYSWAKESDVFIFYRTQGLQSMLKLHKEGAPTLCVMEEVNSHIQYADEILSEEYKQLGYDVAYKSDSDLGLRLRTYDEADAVLCPSEFVRRSFIEKGFSPEKLIKVNFGFPQIVAKDSRKNSKESFKVLYVGQLHYRKGLRYAIEAFKKLKHPNKEFVIVGPKTPLTGLENIQIPAGVSFTGPLKGEELNLQYSSADVFILPSLEEGLALVQGEALAFGIPLLITTNTGGDDIIKDGVEGYIVPPANADALAERLQNMADDRDLLNNMAENALIAAKKLGSWDVAAEKLISGLELIQKAEVVKFT